MTAIVMPYMSRDQVSKILAKIEKLTYFPVTFVNIRVI